MMRPSSLLLILLVSSLASPAIAEQDAAADAINYDRDIAPILQRNCIACHREKQAEGGLSLETPQGFALGGDSGSLLVPKQPESSLLYVRARGDEEPIMPPENNTVGAKPLTKRELHLLKTWIVQGASIDQKSGETTLAWQPIPESNRSSYSIAVSPDNQLVAVGHANRVELIDANTGESRGSLVDENLSQPGVADVDIIQSIAFSPWGERIATGGYRTVRIWKRIPTAASVPMALESAIGNCAISTDRSSIAIINAIGDVEVWDLDSSKKRFVIPGSGVVTDIDWRQRDSLLIGREDGHVQMCSSTDGTPLSELKLDRAIRQIARSSDGHLLAALGTNARVLLFEDGTLKPLRSVAEIKDATSVQFVDPKTIAISTDAGVASLIDVASDQVLHQLDHGSGIVTVATHTASGTVATGGQDGKVKLWNVSNGTLLHTLEGDPRTQLQIASLDQNVSREQSWINELVKRTDTLNKLVEKETLALVKVTESREKASKDLLETTKKRDQSAKQIADTEQKIAAADMQVQLANRSATLTEQAVAKSDIEIAKIEADLQPLEKQSATLATELQAAQLKADEAARLLAIARKSAEKIATNLTEKKSALTAERKKISDAKAQLAISEKAATAAKATLATQTEALAKHRDSLAAAAKEVEQKRADLAEREQAFVTATKTRDRASAILPQHQDTIRRRTNRLGDLKYKLASLTENLNRFGAVTSIAYAKDGKSVAIVDSGGRVRTFDCVTAIPLDRFDTDGLATVATPSGACFLDNHRLIICRPAGRPQVINVDQSWTLDRTIGGIDSELISDRVTALDFGGAGTSIAIGSGSPSREGQVLIVGVASGSMLRRFENVHSDTVLCVRFSPDSRTLATASADKTIRLLNVQSEKVIGALDGHTHHVLSLAWKRDGRLIASGSADGTIKTWDAETGQRKRTITGFPDEVTAVEFLRDSSQVISSCADGQIRIHETNNGALVRATKVADDFLFALGISSDGNRVLSGGRNGVINVWMTENLKSVGTWK